MFKQNICALGAAILLLMSYAVEARDTVTVHGEICSFAESFIPGPPRLLVTIEVDLDGGIGTGCEDGDDDGDGEFNEDPIDGIDNDGDGSTDEDPNNATDLIITDRALLLDLECAPPATPFFNCFPLTSPGFLPIRGTWDFLGTGDKLCTEGVVVVVITQRHPDGKLILQNEERAAITGGEGNFAGAEGTGILQIKQVDTSDPSDSSGTMAAVARLDRGGLTACPL